jgi:hypothetical protein
MFIGGRRGFDLDDRTRKRVVRERRLEICELSRARTRDPPRAGALNHAR